MSSVCLYLLSIYKVLHIPSPEQLLSHHVQHHTRGQIEFDEFSLMLGK